MSDQRSAFDVFLSHNRLNTPFVCALAKALRERGMRVWLDECKRRSHRSWREHIEAGITASSVVVLCVGGDGVGSWKTPEMSMALKRHLCERRPVVSVLLPGTPDELESPPFLQRFTWVDMRAGLKDERLEHLMQGLLA